MRTHRSIHRKNLSCCFICPSDSHGTLRNLPSRPPCPAYTNLPSRLPCWAYTCQADFLASYTNLPSRLPSLQGILLTKQTPLQGLLACQADSLAMYTNLPSRLPRKLHILGCLADSLASYTNLSSKLHFKALLRAKQSPI